MSRSQTMAAYAGQKRLLGATGFEGYPMEKRKKVLRTELFKTVLPFLHSNPNMQAMCAHFQSTGACPFGPRCVFAHGPEELRANANPAAGGEYGEYGTPQQQQQQAMAMQNMQSVPVGASA